MAAQPPERISGLNVARYLTDSLRGSVLTLRARHEVPSCTDGMGWDGLDGISKVSFNFFHFKIY